jgi:Galactose-3-O-sulfotransferase
MGVKSDFERWMENPQQHNDQVKTLAGDADLEKAKSFLSGMVMGLTEQHELSILAIRELLPEFNLDTSFTPRVNASRGIIDAGRLLETHLDRIRQNNVLDIQLYEYALQEIWPRQLARLDVPRLERELAKNTGSQRMPLRQLIQLGISRAKRNLIYKPYVWFRQP